MHCPKCGQAQISDETRFCSKCGFLLTGVAQIVAKDGLLEIEPGASSTTPRRRGIYQGVFIFLLSFLVVPLVVMATIAANIEPYFVVVSAVLLTVGGLLRIVYALMFESGEVGGKTLEQSVIEMSKKVVGSSGDVAALPPQRSIPASSYAPPAAGAWKDTSELEKTPNSVTETTTKLLERDSGQ